MLDGQFLFMTCIKVNKSTVSTIFYNVIRFRDFALVDLFRDCRPETLTWNMELMFY